MTARIIEEAEQFVIFTVGVIILPWISFNEVKEVNRDLCECCMTV